MHNACTLGKNKGHMDSKLWSLMWASNIDFCVTFGRPHVDLLAPGKR